MSSLPGLGTLINVAAIIIGSLIGLLIGHRLPARTRALVTDVLGLVTLLVGALSAAAVTSDALRVEVGAGIPVLIVLGSLLVGGILGSLWHVEARLERFGHWVRTKFAHRALREHSDASNVNNDLDSTLVSADQDPNARFVEGFVTASLLFVVGPLAILGAISDGLGRGIDQLLLKSVLDGFASIAFAASLGVGVMLSALVVLIYQGLFTVLGVGLGSVLGEAQIAALTATGGLLLIGIGMRLLDIKAVPVADMLPALIIAPLAVSLAAAWH
ncbi:MAG: DUF554 domain-containing protein [Actinobacteria bacterium]|nr:DUF554 domain-containing protein [Actinomycetota bacterium]